MDYPATGWGTRPEHLSRATCRRTRTIYDPGLPFGTYSICLFDKTANRSLQYTTNTATQYDNKTANGSALVDHQPSTGWSNVGRDLPMSRLRTEERGMTLVELLAGISIAVIVSLAAFSLIEAVMKRSGEVSSRVETTQRARQAMDNVTRDLRSQVCVMRSDGSPAMTSARSVYTARPTSITFFGDTADESWKTGTTSMPIPTLRTIGLAGNTIAETVSAGTNDASAPGSVTYLNAAAVRRTEL